MFQKKKESEKIVVEQKAPKIETAVAQSIIELKKEEPTIQELEKTKIKKEEAKKSNTEKRASLISISDLEDELEEIKEESKALEESNEAFTKEDLQKVWEDFVVLQKEKGKSNFATTLDRYEPALLDNCKIEILISNKSQELVIEKEKIDLHEYLRENLKNDNIEVITKIQVQTDEEKIPYTNKDKYEQMSKENPNLGTLKKELGLDFDF